MTPPPAAPTAAAVGGAPCRGSGREHQVEHTEARCFPTWVEQRNTRARGPCPSPTSSHALSGGRPSAASRRPLWLPSRRSAAPPRRSPATPKDGTRGADVSAQTKKDQILRYNSGAHPLCLPPALAAVQPTPDTRGVTHRASRRVCQDKEWPSRTEPVGCYSPPHTNI